MLNCEFEKNISITIVLRKELKCEDTIFAQLEIRKTPFGFSQEAQSSHSF